ncbi:MAG: ammonium transporter [Anaerolineae bacterium]
MSNSTLIDTLWVLICAMLVFVMQAGFLCLETGLTRSKNNINVAIKNLVDFFVSALMFFLFGYGLMFGTTMFGLFGTDNFVPQLLSSKEHAFFLFQIMFATTSVTIVSGAIAERVRFKAYFAIAIFVSLLIYPLFGHWTWAGINMGETSGWLAQLGFVDFAGSSVVHSTGGWVALAILLVVGPRIGRFNQDGSANNIEGANLPLAALGVMLLIFGWFGFNGGSLFQLDNHVFHIIVNTILGASGGLATVLIFSSLYGSIISAYDAINGILVGLVSLTASADSVSHPSAIIIGMIGGVFMLVTVRLLIRYKIDDAVGAIPVHLAGGIWGTVAVAFFGGPLMLGTGLSVFNQLGIQLFGIGVGALWAFVPTYFVFYFLNKVFPLRVSAADEHIGLNVAEHDASTELVSFLSLLDEQSESGEVSLRAPVEPFTEVGQIAERYNSVMDNLEEKHGQLATVLNNSPIALFSTDIFGSLTLIEGNFFQLLKIEKGESIYRLFKNHEESKNKVMSIYEGANQEWVAHIDFFYIFFRCQPIKDETGRITGLTGIAADVTEQQVAEKEREKVIDMLSTSATISEQITTILDIRQLIETILPVLSEKYGFYHAAVLIVDETSKSLRFEYGSDEHSRKMRAMRESIPFNHPHSLIARAARKMKVILANDVSKEPMYLPHPLLNQTKSELAVPLIVDGELVGVLDIQESTVGRFQRSDVDLFSSIGRQIAIAIRNAASFEKAKLSEKRMKEALQRSIEADKAKDDFLARVSHELRTPLGVILGYAEMIQDEIYGKTSAEQNERLDDIINSSNHLTELVNQLLDSAKLNSGKVKPRYEQVELPNLIENVGNQMSVLAKQKGLTFRISVDDAVPAVIESDGTVIRQLLINLLGNAIKFTHKGLVTLEVLSNRQEFVVFVVKDTGIGIPLDFQKSIFEPFQQVDGSRTRTHEGTGLGLAITKRMVEMLGGAIHVNSIEGRGSQFKIMLPVGPDIKSAQGKIDETPVPIQPIKAIQPVQTVRPVGQQPLPEFEQGSELEPVVFPFSKEKI